MNSIGSCRLLHSLLHTYLCTYILTYLVYIYIRNFHAQLIPRHALPQTKRSLPSRSTNITGPFTMGLVLCRRTMVANWPKTGGVCSIARNIWTLMFYHRVEDPREELSIITNSLAKQPVCLVQMITCCADWILSLYSCREEGEMENSWFFSYNPFYFI